MRTLQEGRRLALEKALAKGHFPHVKVTECGEDVCFADYVTGRGFRNHYQLELVVLGGLLERRPRLFVTAPAVLPLHGNRGTINALGSSHSYHLNGSAGDSIEICFTSDWTACCTCVLALWRGFLWVTAYEVHLVTGETIATIIDRWKERFRRREQGRQG